jgi:hypothetical protein
VWRITVLEWLQELQDLQNEKIGIVPRALIF